jgi:hypothetical protein
VSSADVLISIFLLAGVAMHLWRSRSYSAMLTATDAPRSIQNAPDARSSKTAERCGQ